MIGDRIKELRKHLKLTQARFGEIIGLKQNSVALIEAGRETSDQTIFAICREFRVNETWLRTGTGDMFIPSPEDEIENLCERYNLDRAARVLIEKFVMLPDADRKVILDYVCSVAVDLRCEAKKEDLHAEVDRQIEQEKKKSRNDSEYDAL